LTNSTNIIVTDFNIITIYINATTAGSINNIVRNNRRSRDMSNSIRIRIENKIVFSFIANPEERKEEINRAILEFKANRNIMEGKEGK
jgi:hypothetical protein